MFSDPNKKIIIITLDKLSPRAETFLKLSPALYRPENELKVKLISKNIHLNNKKKQKEIYLIKQTLLNQIGFYCMTAENTYQ